MKVLIFIAEWLVWLTWGILDTLVGCIMFLVLSPLIREVHWKGNQIVVKVTDRKDDWGWGFQGGPFIFSNTRYIFVESSFLKHEFGHNTAQLWLMGPLHIFLVTIPSVIRFWYRAAQERKGLPLKPYDSVWFEGTATKWGTAVFDWLRERDLFLLNY